MPSKKRNVFSFTCCVARAFVIDHARAAATTEVGQVFSMKTAGVAWNRGHDTSHTRLDFWVRPPIQIAVAMIPPKPINVKMFLWKSKLSPIGFCWSKNHWLTARPYLTMKFQNGFHALIQSVSWSKGMQNPSKTCSVFQNPQNYYSET